MSKKLFDFCIGNPPYQAEADNNGRKPPVYNYFMEATYEIANTVELITPARFLFEAGQTPKEWNKKMLGDKHFKVLKYEPRAENIFPNTEIKGGVAITIRDNEKDYGEIGIFTSYSELNEILQKVRHQVRDNRYFDSIMAAQGFYKFANCAFDEHPEILNVTGKGTKGKITSRIIEHLPQIFTDEESNETKTLRLLGRVNNARTFKSILRKYVLQNEYIDSFNVILPKASGAGHFGEILAAPDIIEPGEITSDTFVSIGIFNERNAAKQCAKYLKTKFVRTLMGVLKVTQDVTPGKFKYVPLQDFTSSSDIDWSKSIHEIDIQLYRKYGLSKDEIDFIETHVKEMA